MPPIPGHDHHLYLQTRPAYHTRMASHVPKSLFHIRDNKFDPAHNRLRDADPDRDRKAQQPYDVDCDCGV